MILNCSFCSRSFVFFDGEESEWHPGWLCPICQGARASVPADILAQPSAVDEVTAAVKDTIARILVQCLDINAKVTADFPPEKSRYYNAGFTAAIVAVAMCVGITDIDIHRGADGGVTNIAAH